MMSLRRICTAFLAVWMISISGVAHANAQDALTIGLKTGAKAPTDIAIKDQNGALRNFDSLKGSRGLILLFTRSLDW